MKTLILAVVLSLAGMAYADTQKSSEYVMNRGGLPSYGMNSGGDYLGTLFNVAAGGDKWSLGYGSNMTSQATPILTWTTSKVGIGTTSPSTALEVSGTVKATAFSGPITSATSITASSLTVTGGGGIGVTYGISAATAVITNTGAASLDIGGGLNAGTGNVSIIGTDGRIPALTTTEIANLSGANITNLTAANISAGSLASTVIVSSYSASANLTAASASIGGTITAIDVNITGSGQLLLGNASSTAIQALAPAQAHGAVIFNSTLGVICVSTDTAAGSWVIAHSTTTECW